MPTISRKLLTDAVDARAKTIPHITVYRRNITSTPPTVGPQDLRVRPYVVQHPSAGTPGPEEDLVGDVVDLVTTFQLTCVAGDKIAADYLVDLVSARFERWSPNLDAGLTVGRCRQVNDPGPARRDDAVTPPRFWTPLVYAVAIGF